MKFAISIIAYSVAKFYCSAKQSKLYIILKVLIRRIRISNLFCEMIKFRENMSNNKFREIHKTQLKIAKFYNFSK